MNNRGREFRRWERLQDEVQHLRALAGELKESLESELSLRFRERLEEEVKRSERYNHFFSLLAFRTDGDETVDLYERVQSRLRRSDVVTVVRVDGVTEEGEARLLQEAAAGDEAGDCRSVLILLTETGWQGATTAAQRLKQDLLNFKDAKAGVAVYPEDSADPEDLLQTAISRAEGENGNSRNTGGSI